MSITSPSSAPNYRAAMIEQAFRLEYITLAWMLVEAVVAIGSGIGAGSLIVMAFGIDSLIELASACVLIWRLTVELRHGQAFAEDAERKAARIGGALLFALATYVIASAGWKLWTGQGAEFSLPGLTVTMLAIPIMYFLSRRKLQVANAIGSRALRTDAVESITCGWCFPRCRRAHRPTPDWHLVGRPNRLNWHCLVLGARGTRGMGRRRMLRRRLKKQDIPVDISS
jgi:hypothetical protein